MSSDKFFTTLQMSINGCTSAMSIDFGVTNKSERVGKLTSTESRNNEDQLYMYIFVYLFHARHVQVWMISG